MTIRETELFKRQPHKMVIHTQEIRQPTNCLRMFDHFVGLAFKGFISVLFRYYNTPF